MRTSEERVAELHCRMDALKRARSRRKYRLTCTVAYAACLAVTVLLGLGMSRLLVQKADIVPVGVSGSIFVDHSSLGYVVIALIALCLGILVTVFCFQIKKHMDEEDKRND